MAIPLHYYKHQEKIDPRPGTFFISELGDKEFQGYTMEEKWNGWDCPYFESAEAVSILNASQANGYTWEYDIISGSFLVVHTEDQQDWPPLRFPAVTITVRGKDLVVYPIGSWVWSWEHVVR